MSEKKRETVNVTITKDQAKEYLTKNKKNRRLNPNTVLQFSRMMNRGEWLQSPQPIAFDTEKWLLDGQHRLHAFLKSELTELNIDMALNQDPAVFAVLDTGKKRSGADALSVEGYRNTAYLASAAKFLFLYDQGVEDECLNVTRDVTNQQVLATMNNNPELAYSVDLMAAIRSKNKFMVEPSFVAFLHYVYSEVDKAKAEDFVMKYGSGLGLKENDAIHHLRKHFMADLNSRKKMPVIEKRALLIKTFNYHMKGIEVTRLRWRVYSNEKGEKTRVDKFPTILDFVDKKKNK